MTFIMLKPCRNTADEGVFLYAELFAQRGLFRLRCLADRHNAVNDNGDFLFGHAGFGKVVLCGGGHGDNLGGKGVVDEAVYLLAGEGSKLFRHFESAVAGIDAALNACKESGKLCGEGRVSMNDMRLFAAEDFCILAKGGHFEGFIVAVFQGDDAVALGFNQGNKSRGIRQAHGDIVFLLIKAMEIIHKESTCAADIGIGKHMKNLDFIHDLYPFRKKYDL